MEPIEITIARTAHEVNRAYCLGLGDDSHVPWDDTPQWKKEIVIAGVKAVMDGAATNKLGGAVDPRVQHEHWMEHMAREGWMYGPVKDRVARTHPCMVPYSELPPEHRAKDKLFSAVVEGMLPRS